MNLHFEFNKKTETGYLSVVKNENGKIIAEKITKEKFDVDKFTLNLIKDKTFSLDFRKKLKKARKKAKKEYKKEIDKL